MVFSNCGRIPTFNGVEKCVCGVNGHRKSLLKLLPGAKTVFDA